MGRWQGEEERACVGMGWDRVEVEERGLLEVAAQAVVGSEWVEISRLRETCRTEMTEKEQNKRKGYRK